eukprot:2105916-Rhodomonas_salina.1
MSGTDIAYAAMCTVPCPVLTSRMLPPGAINSEWYQPDLEPWMDARSTVLDDQGWYPPTLPAYTRPTKCPVLTTRTVLHPRNCPVLLWYSAPGAVGTDVANDPTHVLVQTWHMALRSVRYRRGV